MPLAGYGYLIGKVVASRPQGAGHPHWLVMVQPKIEHHPPYRVAVNLASPDPDGPPEIAYQLIDVDAAGTPALKALAARLTALGHTDSFNAAPPPELRLDYVRGGLLDPEAKWLAGGEGLKSGFGEALQKALAGDEAAGALIAVFGTGYPIDARTGRPPSVGFSGVENVHMNQGAPHRTGFGDHYKENGAAQDGGLILLLPSGPVAVFTRFQTQSLNTDANGDPIDTGVAAIDAARPAVLETLRTSAPVRRALGLPAAPTAAEAEARPIPRAGVLGLAAATAAPAPGASPGGYVFADPDPEDATAAFAADVDQYFHTPTVQQQALGKVHGPVPAPRSADPLKLEAIVGQPVPGFTPTADGGTMQFDLIGDSGAPTQGKERGEASVGDLMAAFAKTSPPAFCFHVGDVVYYYGEKTFYYSQFSDIFRAYPAPIFAIPGNHDGLMHDQEAQTPLEAFQAAFCAETPGYWDGFGAIQRSTMTQPGVYFCLDAPLVSIIGLYSNVGESLAFVDQNQLAFLQTQLARLKPDHDAGNRAVILAIHHFPRWYMTHGKDPTSAALDAICEAAGLWPDAVVAGHAHLYERIVRARAGTAIPYFVNGAGGYALEPNQQLGGAFLNTLGDSMKATVNELGFLRATLVKSASAFTLRFDYISAKRGLGAPPADTCIVDLTTHTLAT
ncbi:MAG TPA: DUF2278 family protein [Caulobacteraceae bacterium]|jgi:uncharacterized protein YukJ